jgi:hypothetical protein
MSMHEAMNALYGHGGKSLHILDLGTRWRHVVSYIHTGQETGGAIEQICMW